MIKSKRVANVRGVINGGLKPLLPLFTGRIVTKTYSIVFSVLAVYVDEKELLGLDRLDTWEWNVDEVPVAVVDGTDVQPIIGENDNLSISGLAHIFYTFAWKKGAEPWKVNVEGQTQGLRQTRKMNGTNQIINFFEVNFYKPWD